MVNILLVKLWFDLESRESELKRNKLVNCEDLFLIALLDLGERILYIV